MPSALIVGATGVCKPQMTTCCLACAYNSLQGLGYEVTKLYASKGYKTFGTARSKTPANSSSSITWIKGVDVTDAGAGKVIVDGLNGDKPDVIIVTAGLFPKEEFDQPDFDAEVNTYKVVAM